MSAEAEHPQEQDQWSGVSPSLWPGKEVEEGGGRGRDGVFPALKPLKH